MADQRDRDAEDKIGRGTDEQFRGRATGEDDDFDEVTEDQDDDQEDQADEDDDSTF